MTNKNYVSGRNFEYRVRDYLISKGYFVVRSAGSKTPIDLVGLKSEHLPLLVQCKHGRNKPKKDFTNDERLIKILKEVDGIFLHAFNSKRDIIFDRYRYINGSFYIHTYEVG